MLEKNIFLETTRDLISLLPSRRAQATNWMLKILPIKKPFIGTLFGSKIEVHPQEAASRSAYFLGFYERETTLWCIEYMKRTKPKMIFDIGANFGYFSYLAKAFCPSSSVVSFEPDPYNFSWLQRNLNLIGNTHFTAEKIAVSNQRGSVQFIPSNPQDNRNLWSQIKLDASDNDKNLIDVPSMSIDDYCDEKNISSVDLIKMDIEGAEGVAVEGMSRGLKNKRYKAILIELHPSILKKNSCTPQSIADRFLSFGYKGYQFNSSYNSKALTDTTHDFYKLNWDESYLGPLALNKPLASEWEHVLFLCE
ncbi:FkbM family methyltransferase [bacterium]|nr:FkbM family methyltransferase [bacterium]